MSGKKTRRNALKAALSVGLVGFSGVSSGAKPDDDRRESPDQIGTGSKKLDLGEVEGMSEREYRNYVEKVRSEDGLEAAKRVNPFYEDGPSTSSTPGGANTVYVDAWNTNLDIVLDDGTHLGDVQCDATLFRSVDAPEGQYHYWFWLNSNSKPNSGPWWWTAKPNSMENGINVIDNDFAVTHYKPKSTVPVREKKYRIGSKIEFGDVGYGTTDTVYKSYGRNQPITTIQGNEGEYRVRWDLGDSSPRYENIALNATVRLRSDRKLEKDSEIPSGLFTWYPTGTMKRTF
ncbi:hypothetical protein [Halorubellus litoreus]|uniref:Tat (Twin-arginine translocation) pathway signal sequence n=1 Tax=Halorubellus litoreus TaxID=755308 RepID=A0ABD5VD78_9EURY